MSTATFAYAVVLVRGADAADFLHAQFTVTVPPATDERHVIAAWCDAKGRVLYLVHLVPHADGFLLLLPAGLAAAIIRRLRMYVLRARVEVSDVSEQWAVGGLTAPAPGMAALPADGAVTRIEHVLVLGIDTGGGPGALMLARADTAGTGQALTANNWQLAAIDAGLPEITAATSGLFVPQMLNLHWLAAIDFDKGCYPGQEVVARLHYRGRLTRRMFRLRWQGRQPQVGDDVVDADGKKQGTVIRAAHCDGDAGRLLAVVRVDASEQPLTTADARLDLLDLPYATGDS